MSKTALITGISGQDGAYLSRLLLEKGYKVFGTFHKKESFNNKRLKYFNIENDIQFVHMDINNKASIEAVLKSSKPEELYNLAAISSVGYSFENPILVSEVTGFSALTILESIRHVNRDIKFYQASSSEMFGKVKSVPQNEETAFYPMSPYAVAKQFAHCTTQGYRNAYNLYACSGILFNHESPLRDLNYVTRKITWSATRIKHGMLDSLTLGNINNKRDWGYAKDYVEAMWLMLQQDKPQDFVIGSGETYTIKEFAEFTFNELDINIEWIGEKTKQIGIDKKNGNTIVKISPDFFRPSEGNHYLGDTNKARNCLGWKPKTGIKQLIRKMVDFELRLLNNHKQPNCVA